jgi:nucleotide-binding universal stress UspA family protein
MGIAKSARVRKKIAMSRKSSAKRLSHGGMFIAPISRWNAGIFTGEAPVKRINKIIAPTDLSKLSRPAVRHALETGIEQKAPVIVYNVIDEDGDWFGKDDGLNPASVLVPQHKERLHEFIKENFADLIGKVEIIEVVEAGIPYSKIVKKAEEENADLIVMSTHGRTGIEQIMLGSVTAKVVARASCPVLSIRPAKSSAH